MRIEGARYADGELCLRCDARDGIRFCYDFKGGDYDIAPAKKKRSLNANSYAWVLIDQIAEKLRLDPIEVYRNAVAGMPGITAAIVCVKDIAAPDLIRSWEKDHLGRQAKQFPSETPGFVDVILVYGSSDYDTQKMSVFLDGIIQDARALGIETKDPNDVQSLLDRWKP